MGIVTGGRALFALSVVGLGILSLLSGDFAMNWQPVPAGVPVREALAYLSGALLLIFGLGLLIEKFAAISAVVLTADFLIWLVALRIAQLKSLWDWGGGLGVGETAILVCGAWALLWALPNWDQSRLRQLLQSASARSIVLALFGIGVVLIGIAHFVFAKATADLVPAYLPSRIGFAYLTGALHIAAGVAVVAGIVPRLAAVLEGIMMILFGLMVWLPRVVAAPLTRFEWTAMLVSYAYGAGSLLVAGLFKAKREGEAP